MFIDRIKDKFNINEPIFTEDILNLFSEYSRAYIFRLIKKSEDSGEIKKFSNGIYYLPKKTFFGLSTINADMVIERRYMHWDSKIYGVYGGLKLLNMFSVTTQVPNVIEIVTNNETTRCREINFDGRRFILRKSRLKIDKENATAYTVLQLFSDLTTLNEMDNYSKQKLVDYIKEMKITRNQLLSLAMSFPARTMKKLIGSGILYDVT